MKLKLKLIAIVSIALLSMQGCIDSGEKIKIEGKSTSIRESVISFDLISHYDSFTPKLLPVLVPNESDCDANGKLIANKNGDLFLCKNSSWFKISLEPVKKRL